MTRIQTNAHTAWDPSAFRGRTGTLEFDGLRIGVAIIDARTRFGHLDLLVTPLAGTGTKWIEQHRVAVEPAPDPVAVA